ncbi:putative Pectinesterase precursor [Tripterygium wilfordii]|uniref:Pectinesterase n=1 Tax=Tripterygium wilfordii TaxID=458696 RepID=A0A7J7D0J7_TRIWF|nr:probable pectinesterase/pectinesterase inhibitor 21 [Tripterygium wilfordii]KAF5739885.1 putative Pectinesterase precursor [Tripterygium wilfordii]
MYNDGEGSKKRKRMAIIGISSIFLVAMVIAVTVGVGIKNNENEDEISGSSQKNHVSSSMKAVKAICQPTDYKEQCVRSLNANAGNTTDPKELVKVAFEVAMKHINDAAKKSTLLQDLEKDHRTRLALNDCKELMNESIAELKHSFETIGDFDMTKLDDIMANLKVWLSASITYQETCLDGFQNTTGEAGNKMKAALKTAMQLSSNGLAIVTEMSSALSDLVSGANRRLLNIDDEDFMILGHGSDEEVWFNNNGVRRLLSQTPAELKPNVVVAKDGSGDVKTIHEALDHIPKKNNKTFVIYIKEGVYEEHLQVNRSMTNLMMIGDGAQKTRITGNKNFVDGVPTFHTSTVAVLGDNFIAKNIGFENSAGAIKHQAVALRVSADMSIFYNCSMDGYQDTLYTHAKRQFYRDCTISGTIDFVFGDAAAVFQNCTFLVRKPLDNQQCIVTAQGRKERRQPSALILQNCFITAAPELVPFKTQFKSYLGRPWKEFSRTIIMESFIDDLIQPAGWLPWLGDFGLKTCFYTEFNNWGPGSSTAQRVAWRGIKAITPQHAVDFTPGRFIRGDTWIKPTGVPYSSGMMAAGTRSNTRTTSSASSEVV